VTFPGRARNVWRAWRLQHWSARATYPAKLTRKYATEDEWERDEARLKAHGYGIADELVSGKTVDLAPQNIYLSTSRIFTAGMEFHLPLGRVTYVRDGAAPSAPSGVAGSPLL